MSFDVIIIGGGVAGLSAALWCDELGLSALLLEESEELGGQLLWTHNEIKNYLGIEAKNGREMRDFFVKQLDKRHFERKFGAKCVDIDVHKNKVFLDNGESFTAKFIIVASGIRRRRLNIEGEVKFANKGIISSGKLEGKKAKDKTALVIGGGDAAFENALILAETAKSVTLAYRGKKFRARSEFVEKVLKNKKIKILTETVAQKIIGTKQVEAVELANLRTKTIEILPFEIVLIRIGVEPNTEFLGGKIDLDERGYIKINETCETSKKNIFAIGDVANPISPTISSAAGMGATAVKAIMEIGF